MDNMPDQREVAIRRRIIEMCGDETFEIEVAATLAAHERLNGVGPTDESCRPEARAILNRVRRAMSG